MTKICLMVENVFIESTTSSTELGITVFERVFHKLMYEGGPLGKIQPIYLKIADRYKLFGVLTLNKAGSYSFFPELPDGLHFDHMTFVKDLKKNNHHYTRTTNTGREKVLPIQAELLSNGIYYAATFAVKELSYIKDAPKEIIYPYIEGEAINEVTEAFSTGGELEGSIIINLNNPNGALCIQFFLIPKEVDYKKMLPYPAPVKKFQAGFDIEDGTKVELANAVIPHQYQDEYVLGVQAFFYNKQFDSDILITTSAGKKGFYSKIAMQHLINKKT